MPVIYDDVSFFENGTAWLRLKGKWGMIDKKGNVIVPFIYDNVGRVSDKLKAACLNGKCGLFGNIKKPLSPVIYDHIGYETNMYGMGNLTGYR